MTKHYASHTDAELRTLYSRFGLDRVKSGKTKGHVRMRELRLQDDLVAEAARRGAEYPHNWLAQPVRSDH